MSWKSLQKGKQNKYHNRKTVVDGIEFHSEKEGRRYRELKMLQRAGEISGLRLQEPYELIPHQKVRDPMTGKMVTERSVRYVADFVYVDKRSGRTVVEDTKGYRTPEYRLKRKLFLWRYGIPITET